MVERKVRDLQELKFSVDCEEDGLRQRRVVEVDQIGKRY